MQRSGPSGASRKSSIRGGGSAAVACQASSKRSHAWSIFNTGCGARPRASRDQSSVMVRPPLPDVANLLELALHGAGFASKPGGDLLVGKSFQLPQRYCLKVRLVQAGQKPVELLGHLSRGFRRRLAAEHLFNIRLLLGLIDNPSFLGVPLFAPL